MQQITLLKYIKKYVLIRTTEQLKEENAMENTEELDIDIDDIGTILKSSRLKSKKSMEEISSELCIRKIYLTALEEGDYETLPPIPYGVGYVRTYARYLGLNPERAVKLYKNASQTEEQENKQEEIEKAEINKISGKHIVIGIIALMAIYAAWSFYANMGTAPATLPQEDKNINIEEQVLEEKENMKEQTPEGIEKSETISQTTEITATEISETVEQTPIPEEQLVAEEKVENNKVVVEFTGESWVELKDKKKVYFQGVYHEGDKKEIDYIGNLFLSVGRPENVKVYIKGTEKNILAKKRKMNIPLDSLD